MSVRQLRVMVEHLSPADMRTFEDPWTDADWLLWDASTQMRRLNASYFNAHRGNQAVQQVEPLPRPGQATGSASEPTPAELAAEAELLALVDPRR